MTEDRVRESSGEVVEFIQGLYQAFGDRTAFDQHLHPDITVWETDRPDGLMQYSDLDPLRDGRLVELDNELPTVQPSNFVVDRWGSDHAVVRYDFRRFREDTLLSQHRVTDVLVNEGRGWSIIHHHSERLA